MPRKRKTTSGKDYDSVLKSFDSKYGPGTIFKLGDKALSVDSISTGSVYIDLATGVDGFPLGKIVEIFGKEMSAKSTLAFHCAKICQEKFGAKSVAIVDVENAVDLRYVRNMGVDVENLIVSQPDFGEQALDITIDLIDSGHFKLVILDSVAALVPQETMSKDFQDSKSAASLARMMSEACKKISNRCAKMGVCVVFVNQIRDKIGIMFGKKSDTTGGNALRFYSSLRIEMTVIKRIKDEKKGKITASDIKVAMVKNKVAPPFSEAIVRVVYGEGIDFRLELIDAMISLGAIKRSGNMFEFRKIKEKGLEAFVNEFEKKYGPRMKELRGKVYNSLKNRE